LPEHAAPAETLSIPHVHAAAADPSAVSLRDIAATFLLSVAMLGTQIGWTRIFSFMIWYHFAFLVISTAMLGFTVGGLWLDLRPRLLTRGHAGPAFGSALAFSVTTAVSLLVVCNLPFDGGVLDGARNFALFLLLMLLVAGSFLAAGFYVALLIAARPARVAPLYAANMVGSGAGCALSVVLLEHFLPATTVLVFSLIAWLAALLLLWSAPRRRLGAALTTLVGCALALGTLLSLDPLREPFYMRSTKPFPALSKDRVLARMSNSLATLDLFRADELTGLWGLSDRAYVRDHASRPVPDRLGFCIDGWALTFAYQAEGAITDEPVFDYLPSTLAYAARKPDSALIIGSGGGIDVITALRHGARAITAVEINENTMDVMRQFPAYRGIFRPEQVETVVAEGRSFVTAAGAKRWDVIQLSGVDTLAASQAGAFTLAESYLYTREAFEGYLSHLSDDGVLTLTRWMHDPPRQTLRVITIADAALRALGVADTRQHMMLVTDTRRAFSVFLISRTPFTKAQADQVLRLSQDKDFVPLVIAHRTLDTRPNLYEQLVQQRDKAAFIRSYPFDISVTTDDRPFFFEHTRWQNAWKYRDLILDRFNGHLILLVTTAVVALLGLLFILVPARQRLRREAGALGEGRPLVYFGCLGLGYVLVEMVLVQKLTLYLGNPAYALAVVLCALLVFSGLGSLLSPRVAAHGTRGVVIAASAVALALVVYRLGLDAVLSATLAQPLSLRVALALCMLALPATLMGLPFPTAVRALGDGRRALVVRGWVLNGYFSVLGACLSMILSISFGFGVVLLLGAVLYGLAAYTWAGVRGQVAAART
jgi:hypothetical protein